MNWKIVLLMGMLMILVVGCGRQDREDIIVETDTPARDGIFIHVTAGPENPHRVLMALQMAVLMSGERDVMLYFDIEGVHVLLKDAPDLNFSHFPSSHTQIGTLLAKGVIIAACPGCLKAAGKTADDLMDGVRVADKNDFFGFTDGRILTVDY